MEKRILSILVDNTSGVLSRVAGLFSRQGNYFKESVDITTFIYADVSCFFGVLVVS